MLFCYPSLASAVDFAKSWQGSWKFGQKGFTGRASISQCQENHCLLTVGTGTIYATCAVDDAPLVLLSATQASATTSPEQTYKNEPCRFRLFLNPRGRMDIEDEASEACNALCGFQKPGFGSGYRRVSVAH